MELSDDLRCLYSATIERRDGSYVVDVPERDVVHGELQPGDTYRVGLIATGEESTQDTPTDSSDDQSEPSVSPSEPPVDEGDICDVDIEDVGEQGDGLARIGPGYVVFIPDTDVGDEVTIEITEARENVAFGTVVTLSGK